VSEALRARVLAAMQDLGYEPNAVARSLKIRRSNTLGLIVSDLANPFFTSVIRGVEDVTQRNGYALMLCNSHEDPEREQDYIRLLRSRRVDGLVIAPVGERHEQILRLVRQQFPLVLLDRDVAGVDASAVLLDNERAAFDAVAHLVRLGHRRIGMITGRPGISTTAERIAGYRRALDGAGIAPDEHLVMSGASGVDGGSNATAILLARRPRPTALFVSNNVMTIGALGAIDRAGLAVPGELSVVSFDDLPWTEAVRPRLTAVAQPTYQIGRTAADLVLRLIDSVQPEPARRVVLPAELVVRESTAEPPAAAMEPEPSPAAVGEGI